MISLSISICKMVPKAMSLAEYRTWFRVNCTQSLFDYLPAAPFPQLRKKLSMPLRCGAPLPKLPIFRSNSTPLLLPGSSSVSKADVEGSISCCEVASHMPEKTMATASSIPSPGWWRLATGTCARLSSRWRDRSPAELREVGLYHPVTVKSDGPRLVHDKVLGC